MAAQLKDVAYRLVSALRLQHDGYMPDVGHITHVEYMPWGDLAEERLQHEGTDFQAVHGP